jgi:hypothetical protein
MQCADILESGFAHLHEVLGPTGDLEGGRGAPVVGGGQTDRPDAPAAVAHDPQDMRVGEADRPPQIASPHDLNTSHWELSARAAA